MTNDLSRDDSGTDKFASGKLSSYSFEVGKTA